MNRNNVVRSTSARRIIARVLLASFLLSGATHAQVQRLVVFGDSISDSGNFFAEFRVHAKAPFAPIPGAPYAIGGNHFSNGATWVEQMAVNLGLNPSALPSSANPGVFTNYAVGRARARAGAPIFPFSDLGTQVSGFLSDFGDSAPPDATYILWIGTNDARDAFAAGGDPVIIGDSIAAIAGNVALLAQKGARDIVVLNVPDLGLLPAINRFPDPIPAQATGFTVIYNGLLSSALDAVEPLVVLAGGTLRRVDTFAILNGIVSDPNAAGLTNVTDAYLQFGAKGNFMSGNPNVYLFWDGGHPTVAGHGVLAEAVEAALTGP